MDRTMWDWTLEVDKRAEEDPDFFSTPEGKACTRIVRAENERLKLLMASQKAERADKAEILKMMGSPKRRDNICI